MCEVLQVSRSGYYAWVDRPLSARATRQAELKETIAQIHQGPRLAYGSPRIHADLAEQGIKVCVNTVAKLMKQAEIRSIMHRRFVVQTTDSNHGNTSPACNARHRQWGEVSGLQQFPQRRGDGFRRVVAA